MLDADNVLVEANNSFPGLAFFVGQGDDETTDVNFSVDRVKDNSTVWFRVLTAEWETNEPLSAA